MKITKELFYSATIATAFIATHTIIEQFKLNDVANLILSLAAMLVAQLTAFYFLKRETKSDKLNFKNILPALCLTQFFSIIFLSLNSAFNPLVDRHQINLYEIFISLLIFSGVFPLITAGVIWLIVIKRKKNYS